MKPINEFNEQEHTGRILIFNPVYPEEHTMRFRIIDSQFVKFMYEVTHFEVIEALAPVL